MTGRLVEAGLVQATTTASATVVPSPRPYVAIAWWSQLTTRCA